DTEATERASRPKDELKSPIGEIEIDKIEANPFQPRTAFDQERLQELSDSIMVHGIIQPVTVRQLNKDKYQLISGERRYQASKLAGLKTVTAFIRTANDQQMLEMALIENIQRENLNAIEIALSYQRLISECSLKQDELGGRVGKNRATVTNYLRLLKLPPDIQIGVRDKKISMGHARTLINVDNPDVQIDLFHRIIKEDLSVRKTEQLVRDLSEGKPKEEKTGETGPGTEITKLQSKLTSHFGTKIRINSDGKKGEIKIPFVSVEDLNRILDILNI
ncbi:MAG: ParB/RepB/Spo0J family partition protein, partial [Cyclobacteriaceae bacterium]|nr:ParB/RepB/Spo0J family partition protein [Cyclobacteriaceae bacterium]